MDAFDFDKRRAKADHEYRNRKKIEKNQKVKLEEEDSVQDNIVSSSSLKDNSERNGIMNVLTLEERQDKKPNKPLKCKWIYWGYEEKSPYYKKNLRKIKSFSTVEEFCSIFCKIKASHPRLVDGDVYCVFKEGIMPLVDDHRNELGGEWMICFERDDKGRPANMENEWLDLLWTVIVENLGDDDSGICGVDIDMRGYKNRDVISVWISDWTNVKQRENILEKIVTRLHLGRNVSINSLTHQ